ncbi:DUF3526 domain-containing protein [Mucilaginibacter sp. UYCu711]|uniref:DUF3526 domain-containing protein n=1 Tax=Mucilaginibacter sp. UYCu711 TaxID=3156339 RepID=UPI003D238F8A
MVGTIAKKEMQGLFRDGRFWIIAAVVFIVLSLALIISLQTLQQANRERVTAQAASRKNWLAQSPKNPHKAAHFGNFVYRLKTPLSLFDNGLDNYTGTSVFLEPHKSDDFQFTQAEDATALLRFGELTPAFLLQTILPLLLIFLCFNAISKEKEDSTLKLILGQGVSMRQLAAGKSAGYWCAIWLVLLPVFIIVACILPHQPQADTGDIVLRYFLLMISYGLYTAVVIILSIIISAYSHSSRSSLIKLLALWVMGCIIIPKLAGNTGSLLYRAPSQYTYASQVKHDEENGLNGHDPNDKRRVILLARQLKKYHVDSVKALPVNFDAVAMVESEKYTTSVYRKRVGEVRAIFNRQNRAAQVCAFIDPYQAIQSTSMALSGTDYLQFTRFQDNTEDYRLYFVNQMNAFMATHTRSGDWTTPFGKDVFRSIAPFCYKEPKLCSILLQEAPAFIALGLWCLICTGLILTLTAKHL